MSGYLFAYGTLQPGLAPADVAPIVARFTAIGEGFVHGALYDLGGYPGAVLDPASQQTIVGTVFKFPDDPQLLRNLDTYEEYDPAEPDTSLFVRVLHPVVLAAGGTLQCWVYVFNRNNASRRILPGGIFQMNA